MGTFLTASATMMCPHGGLVSPVPGTSSILIGGEPVVLSGDTYPIGGCAFNVAGAPHPCLTVQWVMTAQRTTMMQDQSLTTESVGLCKSGDGAVQGPVQIVVAQPRVSGL
jgi:hypothetical protein